MTKRATSSSRKTSVKRSPTKLADLYKTFVVVDTTESDRTKVGLIYRSQAYQLIRPVRAQRLIEMIIELLASKGLSLEDVRALAVLTGPGSYTGVRIGVTVINTLGWVKKLPIIEFSHANFDEAMREVSRKTADDVVSQARAIYS